MNLKQQINDDLKKAMLSGDKWLVTVLRTLKSAILYAEVAKGVRDSGLQEEEIVTLLQKEAKKRQESAELFQKGGNFEKAESEKRETILINKYLPAQLTDEELVGFVERAIGEVGSATQKDMGKIIGVVKKLTEGRVEGGRIANAVKERLS